jgi:ribosomal protein S18 acetylase RimI-like enzyme
LLESLERKRSEVRRDFRKANVRDFDFLWTVLSNTPELQSDSSGNTYDKEGLRRVIKNRKENLVLIVKDKGRLIGFLIVHYLKSVKQSIVNDLFIHKDYRRRGIAKNLMKMCEQDARKKNFKYITGLVRTNNKKMQNLKQKLGFKKGNCFYFYEKRI